MKYTVPVRRGGDFTRAYKKGRYYVGRYMTLYVLRWRQDKNAIGVTASKKVGKSVRRNRLRRLVKENYRLIEDRVRAGFLFIFVLKKREGAAKSPGAPAASAAAATPPLPTFADIRGDMRSLFARAGVFDGGGE